MKGTRCYGWPAMGGTSDEQMPAMGLSVTHARARCKPELCLINEAARFCCSYCPAQIPSLPPEWVKPCPAWRSPSKCQGGSDALEVQHRPLWRSSPFCKAYGSFQQCHTLSKVTSAWYMALIQRRGPCPLPFMCSECSIALLFGIQSGMFSTHFMPLTAASGPVAAPLSASYKEPDVDKLKGMLTECLCKTVGKSRTKEAVEACERQAYQLQGISWFW